MIVSNSIDLNNEREEQNYKMCSDRKLYINNTIYME